MKMKKSLLILWATGALFAAGAAHAGPPVTITFKNLGTSEAKYSPVTSNEVSTNANASPKPLTIVSPQGYSLYVVQNTISADATAATVRYTIGKKTCVFATTFVNTVIPGGLITGTVTKVPKWNKSATASGGATCNATITSTNLSTYAWAVEFTMK
ncbi:hypothetical protein [Musicola keenii]|uniref:hypothetical protein n=1 Tax=Musicola keenii TaxID=2884250 RepID=UPI00178312F0|nr:hypothetical protein [Musicola keenii]